MKHSMAIVVGSARRAGNTHQLVDAVAAVSNAHVYDLADYDITPYDYQHANRGDGFLPLLRTLLDYPLLVLASPVYWYSASSQMKVFMDRFSDLLTIEKDLGRCLRGKSAALVATGAERRAPDSFEQSFAQTFHYLGMVYRGLLYCPCRNQLDLSEHRAAVEAFALGLTAVPQPAVTG